MECPTGPRATQGDERPLADARGLVRTATVRERSFNGAVGRLIRGVVRARDVSGSTKLTPGERHRSASRSQRRSFCIVDCPDAQLEGQACGRGARRAGSARTLDTLRLLVEADAWRRVAARLDER